MIYVFALLMFLSCSDKQNTSEEIPDSILYTVKCTPEQESRVVDFTDFCDRRTSFYSSYCLKSAMKRICIKDNK
jgi:hypothetical protein